MPVLCAVTRRGFWVSSLWEKGQEGGLWKSLWSLLQESYIPHLPCCEHRTP